MALVLCALAQAATAQTIYKCSEGGKVSYGEQPCADGKARALVVPPAPADTGSAARDLARDKARLAALQKERGANEAREEREAQRAARAAATQREKCEQLRLKAKWSLEDLAGAGRDATDAARVKARRQAEALAIQCPA